MVSEEEGFTSEILALLSKKKEENREDRSFIQPSFAS